MLQDLAAPAPNGKWRMSNAQRTADPTVRPWLTVPERSRGENRGSALEVNAETKCFTTHSRLCTPDPPIESTIRILNRSCSREAHNSESKGHSGFAREAPRPTQRPRRNGRPYRRAAFGNQSSHFNTKTPSHQAEAEPEWVATVRAFSDRGLRRLPKGGGGDGG